MYTQVWCLCPFKHNQCLIEEADAQYKKYEDIIHAELGISTPVAINNYVLLLL